MKLFTKVPQYLKIVIPYIKALTFLTNLTFLTFLKTIKGETNPIMKSLNSIKETNPDGIFPKVI